MNEFLCAVISACLNAFIIPLICVQMNKSVGGGGVTFKAIISILTTEIIGYFAIKN